MRYVFVLLALVLAVVVSATSVGIGIHPEKFSVWRYFELDGNNAWQYTIEVKNTSDSAVHVLIDKRLWLQSEKNKRLEKARKEKYKADWIAKYGPDAKMPYTSGGLVSDSSVSEKVFEDLLAPGESQKIVLPKKDTLFEYMGFTENEKYLGILEYELYELPKNITPIKNSCVSTEGLNGTSLYFGWITALKNPDTQKTIYSLSVQSNKYYNGYELIQPELRLILSGANLNAFEIKTDLKRIMISNDSCAFVLPKKDGDFETENFELRNNSLSEPFVCLLYLGEASLPQNPDFKSRETRNLIKIADQIVIPNFNY